MEILFLCTNTIQYNTKNTLSIEKSSMIAFVNLRLFLFLYVIHKWKFFSYETIQIAEINFQCFYTFI